MRTIRDCNVCVVGGAGFLGSHLVNHLIDDRGCNVTVIDNLCAGRAEFVHPRANLVRWDITGAEEYLRVRLMVDKIKYVFNYAAWPYVPDSFKRPLQVFNVNAMAAVKVINAAQEAGVEAILQVSSAELYGEGGAGILGERSCASQVSEEGIVSPRSSYGASKAAVDYFCQASWRERQTPVVALRQFNCVGERETHPYVLTEIISQLFKSKDGRIELGNNTTRDFMYAGDAVKCAVSLLEHGQFGEVYNLGSQEAVTVYKLAQMAGDYLGVGRVIVGEDASRKRPWDIWHLQSDNSKINSVIQWDPCVPLKAAVARTVKWYAANGRKWPWEEKESAT